MISYLKTLKMQKLNKIFNHGIDYKLNLQKSINVMYIKKNQWEDKNEREDRIKGSQRES